MTTGERPLLDTRDMVAVHQALDGALRDAVAAIPKAVGDPTQLERISAFVGEVLWLLHAHHEGEDVLLYPRLAERAPESVELFSRMDSQHDVVAATLARAEATNAAFALTFDPAAGASLVEALAELRDVAHAHLSEEEEAVLPIAALHIAPPEWGELPGHALASYRGDRMWLPLGLVFEAMPADIASSMLEHMPPPLVGMWTGGGAAAFATEMAAVRA